MVLNPGTGSNTFRRDYLSRMDTRDAKTVLAQLAAAFEHFNQVHPHSSLKMLSPHEYREQQKQNHVERHQRRAQHVDHQALHCG
jgi:putative transposase